jgi:hypothetical protein
MFQTQHLTNIEQLKEHHAITEGPVFDNVYQFSLNFVRSVKGLNTRCAGQIAFF